MICILHTEFPVDHCKLENIIGWIIAWDCHDARRQAEAAGNQELAEILYRMEFTPTKGKHKIGVYYLMLVR